MVSKVSIIIPTHNRSDILGQTLDSVLNQTCDDWECIVVDDGSTDYTIELMDFYSRIDNRFKYLHRPPDKRKGAASCRNIGFEHSIGDYIQFLDSDDIISREKLESQVLAMEKDSRICLTTCKWGRFKNNWTDGEIYEGFNSYQDFNRPLDFFNSLATSLNFFPINSYLIRRDVLRKAGAWNEYLSLNDDAEFMSRVILNSKKIKFIKKGLALYRWPMEDNLSGYQNKQKVLDALYSWELIETRLKIRYGRNQFIYINKAKKDLKKETIGFPELKDHDFLILENTESKPLKRVINKLLKL